MRSISITVPTSLSDIKLSQYQKFLRTTKDSEDIKFIDRQLVGIFCNISDATVNNMTSKSFNEVVQDIRNILDIEKKEIPFIRMLKYDDINIGFIPNLDEITVGEQGDLSVYIQDWQKMDKAMGVLFRPIEVIVKDKYRIKPYMGEINDINKIIEKEKLNSGFIHDYRMKKLNKKLIKANLIWENESSKDLTMDVVFGAYFFLNNLLQDLLSCIPRFIEAGVKQDPRLLSLLKNGDGIKASMDSLEEIFFDLKMCLN